MYFRPKITAQPDKSKYMTVSPTVSVSIITYNHEKYIAQAIESVLAQRTDFNFEIIIGDEFSTDTTRKILEAYQQKYPDIISLILHPRRYPGVPGRLNNITNIYACRGKYVALLDGDDFWTDSGKLQLQVDFMNEHENYVAVASDAKIVTQDSSFTGGYYSGGHKILKTDTSFTQENVLQQGWCLTQTSSLLFRNKIFGEFPDWFWSIVSADYGLIVLLSQYGKIKYYKKAYTAYRIHGDSFTAKHFLSKKTMGLKVKELQLLRKLYLPYGFNKSLLKHLRLSNTLNKRISMFKHGYASRIEQEGNPVTAFAYLTKASLPDFSFVYFFNKIVLKIRGRRDIS